MRKSKVNSMLALVLGAFEAMVALKMDVIHNRSNLMTVVFVQYAPGAADTPSLPRSFLVHRTPSFFKYTVTRTVLVRLFEYGPSHVGALR